MKTLGRVAMGVIVAKGVGKMMGGRGGSSSGLGGLLGGLLGGNNANSGGAGGLGGLLGGLSGKSGGGGLGSILDSLGGAQNSTQGGGIGDMLNNALQGNDVSANSDEEAQAEIMLRAMLNAAKSDGQIDEEEKRKITEHLGDDVTEEEADFVRRELESPLDTQALINSVPRGMEEQVYFMSLLAIDLDTNEEARYLDELAKGLNISQDVCNQIHEKLGAPALYS